MSSELEHRTNATAPAQRIDGWIGAMSDVVKLSEYIANTDFVPDAMKGRPDAIAAAILTGREMGLEPMTAIRNIHVIKGKPGISAELMRAQVLAAGHALRVIEASDTRAVLAGARSGEHEWTQVTFTSDQAKRAKIDLGSYPEDKLIARATSRICRRMFADVIAGLSSAEEASDMATESTAGPAESGTDSKPKRTAQRKAAKPKPEPKPAENATNEPAQLDGPPLPDDDETDDSPEAAPTDKAADQYDTPAQDDPTITRSQSTKLGVLFQKAGVTERQRRLAIASRFVGREVASSNELTKQEASVVIDTLENMTPADGNLEKQLSDYLSLTSDDNGNDQLTIDG